MKKSMGLFLCAVLWLMLPACAPAAEVSPAPVSGLEEPTPYPESTVEPPQISVRTEENLPARKAYAAALKELLDSGVLPDGTEAAPGYLGSVQERENMAKNQFSVYDVDGDGREELVLLYTTTSIAGMTGFVYDWDEETGELREQFIGFPAFTFYHSGALQVGWSHNQGKGGDFWPYTLYSYDKETDAYMEIGSVDAWDQSQWPEGYPADIDRSGSGFVYFIYEDMASEWDKIASVDAADYHAWLDPYLGEKGQRPMPYLPLTAEHIQSLLAAG